MSDRDRRLTILMGSHWHTTTPPGTGWWENRCMSCNQEYPVNPDFSTGADKAELMDWAVGQEWYPDFIIYVDRKWWKLNPGEIGLGLRFAPFSTYLWRNLAGLLSEYHKEKVK